MAASIGWILLVTGVITAAGGLATAFFPRRVLPAVFNVERIDDPMMFFVRHWGVLIFVVGALLVYSANDSRGRTPILIGAAAEKIAVVLLIFFGPMKATVLMKIAGISDGLFAVIYLAYLAGA